MAYVDMARSHVRECLREAFEMPEVEVDADGDLPLRYGSSMSYVTVRPDGRRAKVWCVAVAGLKQSAAVLREVNALNVRLERARAFVVPMGLIVEGTVAVESLTPDELRALCLEVGRTADDIGPVLAAVHGGTVAMPDGEGCDTCES